MKKIVINNQYGGFSISDKAADLYSKKKGLVRKKDFWSVRKLTRDDKDLVEVVEELGDEASGSLSWLVIVQIPDDVEWVIEDYDGIEWVSEKHRKWSYSSDGNFEETNE